ncbi:MAG TPA: trypsin-like peptidase domain-containing protein [Candidatus Acidoferrum sp.]|nr:trypsin-like peptidase domain-containing protein [Candidatus Acidoferrum sp.]
MTTKIPSLLLVGAPDPSRDALGQILADAGYALSTADSNENAFQKIQSAAPDILLLSAAGGSGSCNEAIAVARSQNAETRIVVLSAGSAGDRARALDLGADDVVAAPWTEGELLARIRTQLRQKGAVDKLEEKNRIAEESFGVAQTAFQALAVTEKMTRDAFSLERILKIGVLALFGLALVISGVFFLYSHRAEKETKRAYGEIAQLEHSMQTEQQLLASARRLRDDPSNTDMLQQKEQLQKQSEDLKKKLAAQNDGASSELRRQLDETTSRLAKIEGQSQAAESIIRAYAPSVGLLHVSVAFNDKGSGRRLRYGGMDSDGSPLKDSDGNPVYTTEGRGPEVRGDFFGTGFIVGDGKILTNHHVVQPWWENQELAGAMKQGLEPVIAEMTAYFPGEANGIPVNISQISKEADLALVHGDLSELHRPVLKLDASKEAAVSGEALISVGYATGLDAILARAGDDIVQQIVKASAGDPKLVLVELAKRKLIRPLVTQGHVGDVLADKIVYDAQTTSGGSGGPLLNRQGGVIGVTFAIVKGFGGSNFGVPIRFALPLVKHQDSIAK